MDRAIFVQHCQSHHHLNRDARLWPDFRNGLTDLGRRQAQCVAERLQTELDGQQGGRRARVYTSPMRRASETADIIGATFGVMAQTVFDLHENCGRAALERTEDGAEWDVVDFSNGSLFDWRPFPEAETWREFYARVAAAMDGVAQQHAEDETPICVVHGGTLSNIVVWWLGLPLDVLPARTCFSATPGSMTILRKNEHGRPVIERLNDRAHLAALV